MFQIFVTLFLISPSFLTFQYVIKHKNGRCAKTPPKFSLQFYHFRKREVAFDKSIHQVNVMLIEQYLPLK